MYNRSCGETKSRIFETCKNDAITNDCRTHKKLPGMSIATIFPLPTVKHEPTQCKCVYHCCYR